MRKIQERNKENRLHINLGYSCNNNCIFCMEEDREARLQKYISQTEEEIMDMLQRHQGSGEVMFTSGEPTMHPLLPKFIKTAKQYNYKTIGLITNARRLSYFKYAYLLVLNGLNHVVVSIHGHTAQLHNRLTRSKNSFSQTVDGIKNLVRLRKKFALKIHTSTVVTKQNNKYFGEIYTFLKELGVEQVVFNYIQAQGRGKTYFDALFPKFTQTAKLFAEFIKTTEHGEDCFLLDIPYCTTMKLPDFARGFVEKHFHYEVVSVHKSEHKEDKEKKIDTKVSQKYEIVDIDDLDLMNKIKRSECKQCKYFNLCTGIWKIYIEKFAWDEFQPVK